MARQLTAHQIHECLRIPTVLHHPQQFGSQARQVQGPVAPVVAHLVVGRREEGQVHRFVREQGEKVEAVWVPADLLVRPGPRTPAAVEIIAKARRGGGFR